MVKPHLVRDVLREAPGRTLSVVAVLPEEWAALHDGLRIDWVTVDPGIVPGTEFWVFHPDDPDHWLAVRVVRLRGETVTVEALREGAR